MGSVVHLYKIISYIVLNLRIGFDMNPMVEKSLVYYSKRHIKLSRVGIWDFWEIITYLIIYGFIEK